jgi:hypothetical protein
MKAISSINKYLIIVNKSFLCNDENKQNEQHFSILSRDMWEIVFAQAQLNFVPPRPSCPHLAAPLRSPTQARARMVRLTRQLETEQSAAERHSEALQHQLGFLQTQITAKRGAYMALAAAAACSDVVIDTEPAATFSTSSSSFVAAALSSIPETQTEGSADANLESAATSSSLSATAAAASSAPPPIGLSNESDMFASLEALYASVTTVEETKPLLAYLANQVVVWKRKRIASARETSEMHERLEQCQQQAMDAQHRVGAIKLEADRRLMEQQVVHEREKRQLMLELQGLSEEWARTGGVSSGLAIGVDADQFTVYRSDAAIDSHDRSATGKASHHHTDAASLSSSRIGRPSRRLRTHVGGDAAPSAFSGVVRVGGTGVPLSTGASAPPFLPSSHSGNAFLGPLSFAPSVGIGGTCMGGIIGAGGVHLGPFNPAALERLITPTVSSQNKLKTHEVAAGSRRRPPPTIASLVASAASGSNSATASAASTAEADAAAVANLLPAVFHRLASSDTVVSAARKRSDSQDRSQQPSASALIASRGIAVPGLHAVSGQGSGVATLVSDGTLVGSTHLSPVFGATASSPSTPTAAFVLGRGSFDDGLDTHADHLASGVDDQSQTQIRGQHSQFAHLLARLPDEPLRSRDSYGSLTSGMDNESVGSARSHSRPHSSLAVSRASLDDASAASIASFGGAADDGFASGAEFDSFSAIGNAAAMATQHVSHATRLRTSNAHHHPSRGNANSASASGSVPTWMQPTISSSNNNHQHAAGDEGRSESASHSNRPATAGAPMQSASAKSVVHDRLHRTKLESHKMAERPGTASAALSASTAASLSTAASASRGSTGTGGALSRPASARERNERPNAHHSQSHSHAGDINLALSSMHAGASRKPKSHTPAPFSSALTASASTSAAAIAPSSDSSDDDSSASSSAAASARGPSLATLEMMFADIASSGRDGPSPTPNHSAAEHDQHDSTVASTLAAVSHAASETAGSVALSSASRISPDFQLETYFSPPPAPLVRALSRLRSSSASGSPSVSAGESDENSNAVIGNYRSSQHHYTPRTHEATSAASPSGSSPSPLPLGANSSLVVGSAVKSRFGVDSSMQMRESELASMMSDFEQSLKTAPRRE